MKLTKQENWHVRAYPGYCLDDKDARRECNAIEDEIHKHCDSVYNTEIEYDTVEYCEFCNCAWEDGWGEPECCEAAVVDWERSEYCYQCFEKTNRHVMRKGDTYNSWTSAVRCERCKRWFCSVCFNWHSYGMCDDCTQKVEELKKKEEHEKKFKGRRIIS